MSAALTASTPHDCSTCRTFFFDDIPDSLTSTYGGQTNRRATEYSESGDSFADDALSRRETLQLVRAYYRIIDPALRKRVFDLIKSMGSPGG